MTKRRRTKRKRRRTSVLHVEICLGVLLVEEGLHEALHYPPEDEYPQTTMSEEGS
jgi:hypothetical protein